MYLFRLVFLYSLNKYPKVGYLDHMVVLFLNFQGVSIVWIKLLSQSTRMMVEGKDICLAVSHT